MRHEPVLACLVLSLCSSPAVAAPVYDFVGSYAPNQWVPSGITGGSATVDVAASSASELVMHYDVDLGTTPVGVTYRTSDYSVVAQADGEVSFSWEYTYDHRIHQTRAELYAFGVDATGQRVEVLIHSDTAGFGSETYSGSFSGLDVFAGRAFGVRMGGSNVDSDSEISGTLILSDFVLDELVDCNGVPGGPATEDMCGTCDSNPANDCVQDCNGIWGGTARLDGCGTCDSNPNNDCGADCNGVPGGSAVQDMCGTCDSNPGNDCVQDCLGVWGGLATLDGCGDCDADPTNDCGPDCAGVVGGPNLQDMCGTCDADPSNDCEQDCRGVWGGPAQEDMCGVCDTNPADDCEQDCDGVWGGDAFIDDCGDCVGGTTNEAPCDGTEPTTPTPTGDDDDDDDDDGTTVGDDDDDDDIATGGVKQEPATFTRAGCGCASGGGASGAWWLLVGLAAFRRRTLAR